MATDEENGWREAAAAYDGGNGIPLEGIDPDEKEIMNEVYAALKVSNIGAKARLNKFIQKLRSEFNQQLGGKLGRGRLHSHGDEQKRGDGDQLQREEQRKRRKDLSNLSPHEVVKELRDIAASQIGNINENPKVHRWPYSETVDTWDRDSMQTELCRKRELVHERLKTYKKCDRQNVVIGMRLGSGFGKTHLLTEAPHLLGAQGLYVSYNNQDLRQDRDSPVQALLVRLMLSACGCNQLNCGEFVRSENFEYFRHLRPDFLRNCFLDLAKKTFQWGEIVIGVDEIILLGEDPIKLIISELSEISHVYTTLDPKSRCTCIVSSLQDKAFATKSGRSVEDWNPRHADRTTFEHFARAITSMEKEKSMALASAVCGNHLRSIVIAFDEIRKGTTPTVRSLLSFVSEKLGNKISVRDFAEVIQYVQDCIRCDPVPAPSDAVEPYVGEDMALPPVIMAKAFEGKNGEIQLHGLLKSFSVFDGGAGKQLEEIGKCYDLFRAAMKLPVIPAGTTIHNASRPFQWYRKLVFDADTEESNEDLLKMQKVAEKLEVVRTNIMPEWGKYYHPGSVNHPWLDRLVVGTHEDGESKCMVIYQDKVNRTDFASACENLSKAADLLSAATGIGDVLLVVNIVGATKETGKQESLKWPHILVRDSEITNFYSCNVASMVEFARKRHELSLGLEGKAE